MKNVTVVIATKWCRYNPQESISLICRFCLWFTIWPLSQTVQLLVQEECHNSEFNSQSPILSASKDWLRLARINLEKKLAKLTAVGVDDEAAAGVGDPAWLRHGPKMIWPYILNASKKWIESCQDEPGKQTCQAHNGPCG